MNYGFYTDLEELREEYEDADWGFLENEISYKELTPHDFLHGYCFEFARHLHELYGYQVECIYGEDGSLIHAYCVIEKDSKPLFIDIRGCTDDWEDFTEEFADWMSFYDEPNYRVKQITPPKLSKKDLILLKDVLAAAKIFEQENKDFYDKTYW